MRIYQNTKEEDLKQTYLYLHIFEDAFFKSGLAIARWPVGEDERGMGTSQTLANQNIWANEWKYFSKVYIIKFFFMLNSCLLNINYVLVIVDNLMENGLCQAIWLVRLQMASFYVMHQFYIVYPLALYTCYTSRCRLLRLAVSEYDDTWHKHQPHIHYIKGISKEVQLMTIIN